MQQGAEVGIEKIAGVLNEIMWQEQKTTVLLETMAGKGTEVGSKFEEIKAGMYVWDNVYESMGRVDRVLTNCNRRRLHNRYSGGGDIVDYEENRYYPIQIPIIKEQ